MFELANRASMTACVVSHYDYCNTAIWLARSRNTVLSVLTRDKPFRVTFVYILFVFTDAVDVSVL